MELREAVGVGSMLVVPFGRREVLGVVTRLNGEVRQEGSTRDLIFPVDALLRYITAAMTLMPGGLCWYPA